MNLEKVEDPGKRQQVYGGYLKKFKRGTMSKKDWDLFCKNNNVKKKNGGPKPYTLEESARMQGKANARTRAYYARLSPERKSRIQAADSDSRRKRVAERRAKDNDPNWKICTHCGSYKELTAFKKLNNNKYTKLCDYCLTKAAMFRGTFTDKDVNFWRAKAYSTNTGALIRLVKTDPTLTIQTLKNKVVGEDMINLFIAQEQCCFFCKKDLTNAPIQLDHKQPLSKEGLHTLSNLAITCNFCNRAKHDSTEDEYKVVLRELHKRLTGVIELWDKEPTG